MEIASFPAIEGAPHEPAIPEPISPELVLVDPELRRELLAGSLEPSPLRLEPIPLQVVHDQRPPQTLEPEPTAVAVPNLVELPPPPPPLWVPPAPPLPEVALPEPQRVSGTGARLVRILLPISLALNAVLIAVIVSDSTGPQSGAAPPALTAALPNGGSQTQPAPKPARSTRTATTAAPKSSAPKGFRRSAAPPRTGARSASVERKLLTLVVQSPAGKLPKALIDSKTGLAKNNLQAVCRRESGSRSFLCVVQPARHKPGEGAYVRYRLNRSGTGGTFTWSRYRNG